MKCLSLNPVEGRNFALNVYMGHYQFFSNKVLDLGDTIFFVFRKRQSQITFLHVFHHVTMVAVVWIFGRYTPGTEASMAGLVNLVIHVVMYSYYFLASFGDRFASILRFKRYLTIMQIMQFLFVLAHCLFALACGCTNTPIIVKLVMFEEAANLLLFLNFYRKTYGPGRLEAIISKFAFCQLQLTNLFAPSAVATTTTDENRNEKVATKKPVKQLNGVRTKKVD